MQRRDIRQRTLYGSEISVVCSGVGCEIGQAPFDRGKPGGISRPIALGRRRAIRLDQRRQCGAIDCLRRAQQSVDAAARSGFDVGQELFEARIVPLHCRAAASELPRGCDVAGLQSRLRRRHQSIGKHGRSVAHYERIVLRRDLLQFRQRAAGTIESTRSDLIAEALFCRIDPGCQLLGGAFDLVPLGRLRPLRSLRLQRS